MHNETCKNSLLSYTEQHVVFGPVMSGVILTWWILCVDSRHVEGLGGSAECVGCVCLFELWCVYYLLVVLGARWGVSLDSGF